MSEIYTVIVVILGILAISGLFVGVTNDAVNFLNSAIGSKAASMRVILTVASVGIIVGVVTSSGMMEVARSGMFNPGLFTFHEVMMLYLGVMFANIILLDLYNSWGLPTSTTVSLIFCLLGSAIAVSIYKISNDPALGVGSLGHFINTSRAMGIVSAILLSVVIAFTCGTIVMYISRTIFSFRYTVIFRRFGSLWCGASLTAIIYFAVFKGLKSLLADNAFVGMVDRHLLLSLFICWVACSVLLFFIQRFKINILRITILSGTFALALAFAGNDLVNFIGRIRRLLDRQAFGGPADDDGGTLGKRPGQFPDSACRRGDDDPHALDFEKGHARLRNRVVALRSAGRRRPRAVRFVGHVPYDCPRSAQYQRRHRTDHPRTRTGSRLTPF
mgnify:CR=1 FL=1